MVTNSAIEALKEVSTTKAGVIVAAGSIASDATTKFGWIPDDIGNLASFFGVILSVVLIITHLIKFRYERRKALLEIKKMEDSK